MDIEDDYRIVDYFTHCKTCKYENTSPVEMPCNECLEYPVNLYTDKPVNWKEK